MTDTTQTSGGTPSPNNQGPENYGGLGEALSVIMANAFKKIENMLPCRVISYDRVANTAIVHPLIKVILNTGGSSPTNMSRPQIGPIPVFAFGAGNFVVNYPIKAGDLGWMLANDRDISNYLDALDEAEPHTYRSHNFSDAVLFPDVVRNFDTTGEDGNMVIQSLDGTIRISLGTAQLKLTHPTKIFLDAPMVEFKQDAHGPGTATFDTDVLGGGKSLKSHTHGGVQSGGSNTTPPN